MPNKKLTRRGLIATGAAAPALAALHEAVPHPGIHRALGGQEAEAAEHGAPGAHAGHANPGEGISIHDGFGGASVRAHDGSAGQWRRDIRCSGVVTPARSQAAA